MSVYFVYSIEYADKLKSTLFFAQHHLLHMKEKNRPWPSNIMPLCWTSIRQYWTVFSFLLLICMAYLIFDYFTRINICFIFVHWILKQCLFSNFHIGQYIFCYHYFKMGGIVFSHFHIGQYIFGYHFLICFPHYLILYCIWPNIMPLLVFVCLFFSFNIYFGRLINYVLKLV